MASFLLIISVLILVYLSVYGLIFVMLGLTAFWLGTLKKKRVSQDSTQINIEAVSVLIPVWNEGGGLLDAVIAVSEQDYIGPVEINILVKDGADNSIPELLKFYEVKTPDGGLVCPGRLVLLSGHNRQIYLILTGRQTKRDKLNLILSAVTTPFVALLDADHRPTANWLSSSAALFETANVAAVQTRRRPLGLRNLAQIWDSVQNHGGNELLNNFLTAFRRGIFFTGTAAVFKTDIIRRFNLSDSITEDTYLSYDLWGNGYKIVYNDQAASYEEVSPSLGDYVARRRRWSAGHNQSFFSHLGGILTAPISYADKLVLLLHGQFYLIPLAVWLLLSTYGVYFFAQLGSNFQVGVILSALFLGGLLAYAFRQSNRRFWNDWPIAALWFLPQLAVWAVYVYKFMGAENYYYILIFPYAKQWISWHAVLFLAPLMTVLAGFYFFKDSRQLRNLLVIPTYILTLFLDIYACLLGFWDFIWGRAYWSRIARRNSYSAELLPPDLQANLVTGRPLKRSSRFWLLLVILSAFFLIILNDLLAVNNCGEIKYFLWRPLILKNQSTLDWQVKVQTSLAQDGRNLQATVISDLKGLNDNLFVTYYVDGRPFKAQDISGEDANRLDLIYPLGWEKHTVAVELRSRVALSVFCRRELPFSTAFKELRGRDLYINNEKFLIKGLIPSFNASQMDLSLANGLAQIKDSGANVLRFYHRANEKLLQEAARHQLLVIDQPDRSTWNELDLASNGQVASYIRRYQNLVQEHQGEPYILWDGLGNEWELGGKMGQIRAMNLTNQTIAEALQGAVSSLTSYSTYFTFIKYPVDISGINMLDTGRTYWETALAIIQDAGKPFYASEFGGFVAFREKTDPELRINRILSEWPLLLKAGALGANFYESHDNWAQSVVVGYNDPFKNDQPDDTRGFWDDQNRAKPELKVLEKIFSDLQVEFSELVISDPTAPVSLVIKNIREYNLKQVTMIWPGGREEIGDFKPGESRVIKIILGSDILSGDSLSLKFIYTSHTGLSGVAKVDLRLPVLRTTPVILNDDFESVEKGVDRLSGRLLSSDHLSIILPDDWRRFSLNGQDQEKTATRLDLSLVNPYHAVDSLEFSRDGRSWKKVDENFTPESGDYYFRFYWPKIAAAKQSLLLAGLGAPQVELILAGRPVRLPVHSYRENLIGFDQLGKPRAGDQIIVRVYRNQTVYVDKNSLIKGLQADFSLSGNIGVKFERPRVFAPLNIELKKNP